MITQSQYFDESLIFSEQPSQQSGFLHMIVDEIKEYKCDCMISESCNICETKKWMQMLTSYNSVLAQECIVIYYEALPLFPEANFNIPLYLSKTYLIVHQILTFKNSLLSRTTSSEDEIFKFKSDNEALKVKIRRLQDEVDLKCKQLGQVENQMCLLNNSNKQGLEKALHERDEFNKMQIKMQTKMTHMQNDFKKKESDFMKMRDQVLDIIKNKSQVYANRFEVAPLGRNVPQFNGLDGWVQVRKNVIEEANQYQETLYSLVELTQQFYKQFEQYIPLKDTLKADMVRLPKNCHKCIQPIQKQFDSIITLVKLLSGSINEEEFKQQLQQQIEQQQLQVPHRQHTKHQSLKLDSSMVTSRSVLDNSMTSSLVSRISLKDVNVIDSPTFKDKDALNNSSAAPTQLKKWEFVFKN